MKKIKSHFKFTKQERSGIFFLLLVIIFLQVGYFVYQYFPSDEKDFFKVDIETQSQIDAIKLRKAQKDSIRIFPFNPNFITDYKGYTLGMSVEEIDRLHGFRAKDEFVNSAQEFQKVTQVSDSLLHHISPYFKFPEWTKKNRRINVADKGDEVEGIGTLSSNTTIADLIDINSATAEDLRAINGIGEKLSTRIIKFRDRLGGFMSNEQLYDVYGLEPQVVKSTLNRFQVLAIPQIEKINVNSASAKELQKLIYLQKNVAIGIVNYRNDNGTIVSFDELINIEGFPVDKINRIILYLSLK